MSNPRGRAACEREEAREHKMGGRTERGVARGRNCREIQRVAWRRGSAGRVEITVAAEVFALHVNYRRHRCIQQVSYICNALLSGKTIALPVLSLLDTPADTNPSLSVPPEPAFQPFCSFPADQDRSFDLPGQL